MQLGSCWIPSVDQSGGRIPYDRGACLELRQNRQMVTKEPIGSMKIIVRWSKYERVNGQGFIWMELENFRVQGSKIGIKYQSMKEEGLNRAHESRS